MNRIKFSIVIPTYNSLKTLRRTVDSIVKQDYPKNLYEIIIVDDGSNDGTAEYLKEISRKYKNIRFFTQKNSGPAKARNRGVRAAKYEYIVFTDADCLVPKNWLSTYEKEIKRHPEIPIVGGFLEASEEKIKENNHALFEYFKNRVIYGQGEKEYIGGFETPGCVTNNVVYKKDVFIKLGGFNENFPVAAGEDADLKLRAAEAGYKMHFIPMKVTHLQEYGFKRFIKQSKDRGLGGIYYDYLKGKKPNKIRPIMIIFLTPVIFLWYLVRYRKGIKKLGFYRYLIAVVYKSLETLFINYGKIKHPKMKLLRERMKAK
ncbi:glycosyl transferase [Candidatus Micrarchaeota archaeon]|nr:MAG: glycosyl transferase [Candidatus Micrarchaeota archaeon]